MKKIVSFLLILVLMLSLTVGCAKKADPTPTPETPNNETPNNETPDNTTSEEGIVKLGIGQLTSIASSKDLGEKDGKEVLPVGQVDTVIVAAGFDKDGKVVSVSIDNAQTKVNFDKALQVTSDLNAVIKSKVELKEDYGMIVASKIQKEWFEQAAALEQWMVGKTVEEIKAMKVKEVDANHPAVPDVPELTSLVTMSIQDYVAALEEAYTNAVDANGATKVGLGINTSIKSSKGLGTDKDGKEVLPLAQVDTIMSASAFDADGKVVATIIDNAQTKVAFDNTGKVTTDKNAEFKTKLELKEEYGMIKGSAIKKEWFEQSQALSQWMAGKTIDEIKAMKVVEKDPAHPSVPDVPELTSLVTISVEGYIAAVEKSFHNAK